MNNLDSRLALLQKKYRTHWSWPMHEGTNEVKQSRIDLLVQQYELFTMNKDESIKRDVH